MFHVVHILQNGRHRGYEIWHNNERVVSLKDMFTPKGCPCSKFKRHEAYALVRAWNK